MVFNSTPIFTDDRVGVLDGLRMTNPSNIDLIKFMNNNVVNVYNEFIKAATIYKNNILSKVPASVWERIVGLSQNFHDIIQLSSIASDRTINRGYDIDEAIKVHKNKIAEKVKILEVNISNLEELNKNIIIPNYLNDGTIRAGLYLKDHTEEIKQLNDQEAKIDIIIDELESLKKFDITNGKKSFPLDVVGEIQFLRSNPKFYINSAKKRKAEIIAYNKLLQDIQVIRGQSAINDLVRDISNIKQFNIGMVERSIFLSNENKLQEILGKLQKKKTAMQNAPPEILNPINSSIQETQKLLNNYAIEEKEIQEEQQKISNSWNEIVESINFMRKLRSKFTNEIISPENINDDVKEFYHDQKNNDDFKKHVKILHNKKAQLSTVGLKHLFNQDEFDMKFENGKNPDDIIKLIDTFKPLFTMDIPPIEIQPIEIQQLQVFDEKNLESTSVEASHPNLYKAIKILNNGNREMIPPDEIRYQYQEILSAVKSYVREYEIINEIFHIDVNPDASDEDQKKINELGQKLEELKYKEMKIAEPDAKTSIPSDLLKDYYIIISETEKNLARSLNTSGGAYFSKNYYSGGNNLINSYLNQSLIIWIIIIVLLILLVFYIVGFNNSAIEDQNYGSKIFLSDC